MTLRLARDLRVDFFRKVLPLAPLGLGRHRVGDLLARLLADIEHVDGLLVRAVGPLLAFGVVANMIHSDTLAQLTISSRLSEAGQL